MRYLIAEDPAGARLGFAILRGLRSSARSVELVRIALAEPGRGVGRDVLRRVVDLCFGEVGANRLWLDVFDDNERARRAYRPRGSARKGPCARSPGGGTGAWARWS
jgi:RimJ/RimL family protein N-acetyltransferase